MVGRNLLAIALTCLPLSFGLLVGAFSVEEIALKVIMWLGAGALFLVSMKGIQQANREAKVADDATRAQNKELTDVLKEIKQKIK